MELERSSSAPAPGVAVRVWVSSPAAYPAMDARSGPALGIPSPASGVGLDRAQQSHPRTGRAFCPRPAGLPWTPLGQSAPGSLGPLTEPVIRLMSLPTFGWKALYPSACGRDLTWKRGVCPDQVTRRLLRWPLVHYDCVLIKKKNSDTETESTPAGRRVTTTVVRGAFLLRTGRPYRTGTVQRRRVSCEHTVATPRGPLFNRLSLRGHSQPGRPAGSRVCHETGSGGHHAQQGHGRGQIGGRCIRGFSLTCNGIAM